MLFRTSCRTRGACLIATIASPDPAAERDEIVARDKTLDRYETIEYDALDNERLESFGLRNPMRGIMLAVPVGAGFWALIISLVRLALS